ncbi:MAG: HIT family protein, partial [Lentisphaerae bacterium]
VGNAADPYLIHADSDVILLLCPQPVNVGHVFVAPREHYVGFLAIPEAVQGRFWRAVTQIGRVLTRVTGAEGINLHSAHGEVAGQACEHAHVQLIPRWGEDKFHWNWRAVPLPPEHKILEMCHDVRRRLEKGHE